ncbi:MAG: hypothetical protein HDR47_08760, partial [Bacteroides sp.]|nr:hypothetical protein [Bacteroides sp.]
VAASGFSAVSAAEADAGAAIAPIIAVMPSIAEKNAFIFRSVFSVAKLQPILSSGNTHYLD